MLTGMSSHHKYLMWQPLVAKRARTRRGMLSTMVVILLGRTAAHAWRTARRNSGTEEVGSFISRIYNLIWSQTSSMGFRYVLRAGQSMTSTSRSASKAVVSRSVWGVALSWTYNFRSETHVTRANILSRRSPITLTNSLLPPWWMAPIPWFRGHNCHMWVGCTHLSAPPLAWGAHQRGHPCETVWSESHHWKHSAASAWGPTFSVFVCAPDVCECYW